MDLEKNVKLIRMFELYGKSLTEKQQQVFDLYVLRDLSLKEVSDILNISRQAVKFTMDNIEKTLIKFEDNMQICAKFDKIKRDLTEIEKLYKDNELKAKIDKILEEL